MAKTYIIAEAGVNHNGDYNLARKMVLEAKKAGADAVKFQTFVAKNLVSEKAPKAEYQKRTTDQSETQQQMLQKLELTFEQFVLLRDYAAELGIDFISTPFDLESIDFLITLDMPFWKIPSGEITDQPYLIKLARTGKPIMLSTGMSTVNEIREALEIFHGYEASDITLLHCNTEYPTPFQDVNLKAIRTLAETFGVRAGYSDHTPGIEAAVAAAALGAEVIEKHFTLDKSMQGPDHKASLDPGEFAEMVKAIRNIEAAIGDGVKKPTESERKNLAVARKSIFTKRDIKKGELFSEDNLTTKRPGDGISPMRWKDIIGKAAAREYEADEKLDPMEESVGFL